MNLKQKRCVEQKKDFHQGTFGAESKSMWHILVDAELCERVVAEDQSRELSFGRIR
jgi:hypothetical protein